MDAAEHLESAEGMAAQREAALGLTGLGTIRRGYPAIFSKG